MHGFEVKLGRNPVLLFTSSVTLDNLFNFTQTLFFKTGTNSSFYLRFILSIQWENVYEELSTGLTIQEILMLLSLTSYTLIFS